MFFPHFSFKSDVFRTFVFMKALIINNRIIPFGKSYIAINLFGVIFAKERLNDTFLRHELIHTAQQKELLFVGFYLVYIVEWIIRLLICRSQHRAYRSISFEREAYSNQGNAGYLKTRKHYAWIRYIRL